MNLGAELEREKNSQRAKDKALALVRAGHVPGGRCYGYDLVDVMKDGPLHSVTARSARNGILDAAHVEQAVNEREAVIVRRVFEMAAAGVSQAAHREAAQRRSHHVPAAAAQSAGLMGAGHRPRGATPGPVPRRTGLEQNEEEGPTGKATYERSATCRLDQALRAGAAHRP